MAASSEALKVIDLDGTILAWNPACERLYGWTEAEVVGTVLPHIPTDLRLGVISDMRRVAASDGVIEREVTAHTRDGSLLRTRATIVSVCDADGHAAGVLSAARLISSDSETSDDSAILVVAMTHELEGPLTALAGYAQLLSRPEIAGDPLRRGRTLRAIAERSAVMMEVVDDARLAAEIMAGKVALEPEPVDVASMFADGVARAEAAPAGSRFVLDYRSDTPRVNVDRIRFERVVDALLANARSLADGGAIDVCVTTDEGQVLVEVGGCEMRLPGQELSHVFDRFYHEDSVEPHGLQGAGPGLFVAKSIIEAHGGSIGFEGAEDGTGAFIVSLPALP
jgi:PAS domain S-box-containing protein